MVDFCSITLVTTLFVTSSSLFITPKGRGYRAAVYAHKPFLFPNNQLSRREAVDNMMTNVNIYKLQAQTAAKQGADIIVYPENGLYGPVMDRDVLRPYLEPIPDPTDSRPWVPCKEPSRVTPSDILTQLSCIARNNSIYVVANMGSIQPCNAANADVFTATISPCPKDGRFQFNTNVVFDRSGKLIARYHKRTLFGEEQFNTGVLSNGQAERVTFDTPFGRFGVFTCFDILFNDPAVVLAERGIKNIMFPTAWINSYPMLQAVGFHAAWARRHRVNLLAANLHYPELGFDGSGVYSPSGPLAIYLNSTAGSDGRLVVVNVPAGDVAEDEWEGNDKEPAEQQTNIPEELLFKKAIRRDTFLLIKLQLFQSPSGTVGPVCMGETCCSLAYSADMRVKGAQREGDSGLDSDSNSRDNTFTHLAFGVFQGVHTSKKDWYFEACLLVKCYNGSTSSCGENVKGDPSSATATDLIMSFSMYGTFSPGAAKYVYPEVLVHHADANIHGWFPANCSAWGYTQRHSNGVMSSTQDLTYPLAVATLYARDYAKDP